MSTLAITAAHFVAIPVRYVVGRWYNIPTNTLIAFNAADLGLNILVRTIGEYYKVNKWNLTFYQKITIGIVGRSCIILSALYVTSRLTNRTPIECAVMTNLATITSISALVALAEWAKGKKAPEKKESPATENSATEGPETDSPEIGGPETDSPETGDSKTGSPGKE